MDSLDESAVRADERRRIARELHDGLGPALFELRLAIGELTFVDEHASSRAIAERLDASVAAAIESVRTLTFGLRLQARDGDGNRTDAADVVDLVSELRALAAWVTSVGGIPCDLRVDEEIRPVPAERGYAICSAVRELLVNTVRHARAGAANITVERFMAEDRQDHLRIEVEDDGIGLPPRVPDATSGSGLAIVAERINEIGGAAWADPRRRGCLFVLVVPNGSSTPTALAEPAEESRG